MSISFPIDRMRVRFAGATHTGMRRAHNEDSLFIPEQERLVIVADGMGGHASGDVASQLAIETIVGFFRATEDEQDTTWPLMIDDENRRHQNRMVTGIKLANLRIYEMAELEAERKGMGTTVVAGFFCDDGRLILAHVGDSRIYRVRAGTIKQLTEDHSLLNDYIKMKRIGTDEIEAFPHKNVIVRALGMKDTVAVDVLMQRPERDDIYLLCSDGLNGMVDDSSILRILTQERDLDGCCDRLIEAANHAGGIDNITVALARLEPDAAN